MAEGPRRGEGLQALPGRRASLNWADTRPRHWPGIQPTGPEKVLGHSAATVVLSRGMARRLQLTRPPSATWNSAGHGACRRDPRGGDDLNMLAERMLVAGLFHSTC